MQGTFNDSEQFVGNVLAVDGDTLLESDITYSITGCELSLHSLQEMLIIFIGSTPMNTLVEFVLLKITTPPYRDTPDGSSRFSHLCIWC